MWATGLPGANTPKTPHASRGESTTRPVWHAFRRDRRLRASGSVGKMSSTTQFAPRCHRREAMATLVDIDAEFADRLRHLDAAGIVMVAGGLEALRHARYEDLEAMIDIDRALRIGHLERQGAGAARLARDLVVHAAERSQLDRAAAPVVDVSRTAADVAKALVVGMAIGERAARVISAWASLFAVGTADRDGVGEPDPSRPPATVLWTPASA
jgi:hypothetical protein